MQLVSVLVEVKYLELRSKEKVPDAATGLFEKRDTLRKYIENLDLMCKWYNKIRTTTLEVEMPLIQGQLDAIDSVLDKGSVSFRVLMRCLVQVLVCNV